MTYVKIGDATFETAIHTRREDMMWDGRESQSITLSLSYQEALELFVDNIVWSIITEYIDEETQEEQTIERDMSIYAISGPITDNRNGTVTVKMGKYSQEEIAKIPLVETPKNHTDALELRSIIEAAMQSVEDDSTALKAKLLYPTWEELVAKSFTVSRSNFKFRYNDSLYKTIVENVSFASNWVPDDGTESMFVRIDEEHDGSLSDPIPYSGNMILESGKYYAQDGIVYLCTRNTETPIYHTLSELVGLYVEVAL